MWRRRAAPTLRAMEDGAAAGRRRQRRETLVVLLVVAVLGGLSLVSRTDTRASVTHLTVDAAATLAACALVPVLVRWPVPGALALAVLAAFSPAATPAATIAVLRVASERPLATAV